MMRVMMTAIAALSLAACEGVPAGGLGGVLGGLGSVAGAQGGLTNLEIDAGLRQALEIGATNVSSQLGAENGFFGDSRIQIPLPGRLADLQDGLGKVGLAMPEARKLVVSAVQSITLEDAVGILQGGDTAATSFLRGKTEASLRDAFKPYIQTALSQTGAVQSLDSVASKYGLSAVASDLRGDMTDHAVNFGLDGMFLYVAEQEREIRENPVARTTDLLKKVFGSN
jgi:hypothetical protein